jgi:hypothetical protein
MGKYGGSAKRALKSPGGTEQDCPVENWSLGLGYLSAGRGFDVRAAAGTTQPPRRNVMGA